MPERNNVLVMDRYETCKYSDIKHICNINLSGDIFFLYIPSTGSLILRYQGHDDLYLSCQNILPGLTYPFEQGSSLRNSRIDTVYFSDVAGKFSEAPPGSEISISAENVVFSFKNSDGGIQDFNFSEKSGRRRFPDRLLS